jgi:diaminohydroxyphosphoribosylaminopyrimidine deaminase/5-amino-6-(5-phosphoribosylamino)uracil reductase
MQLDQRHMQRAMELAELGRGAVEPNPVVGCVIAIGEQRLAEGHHQRFGGPHAEVNALAELDPSVSTDDATLYVTLEPCCHHGKTPPCTDAIMAAGIRRVVVAVKDPAPHGSGGGIRQLQRAGIEVVEGVLEHVAIRQNSPYRKLTFVGQPWVIAKWAMTLDGKIATSDGDSQWISNAKSRAVVHSLRARVDAILVGRQTVVQDDPLLTARPPGVRMATRIVVDSKARIPIDRQLVQTADQVPVLIAVGPAADASRCLELSAAGCEVWQSATSDPGQRLEELLNDLGGRRWTNILVEGGGQLLGSLFDLDQIDEAHVFIANKLVGGDDSVTPVAGIGMGEMNAARRLDHPDVENLEGDVYIHGPVLRDDGRRSIPGRE